MASSMALICVSAPSATSSAIRVMSLAALLTCAVCSSMRIAAPLAPCAFVDDAIRLSPLRAAVGSGANRNLRGVRDLVQGQHEHDTIPQARDALEVAATQ